MRSHSLLSTLLLTISFIYWERSSIRRLVPDPISLGSEPTLDPIPINVLFRQLIKICIKKAWVQALTALANAKDNANRLLKFQNPNLYYDNLHIECNYFCWQCKDYFEVVGSLNPKHILFVIWVLKNHIFNK